MIGPDEAGTRDQREHQDGLHGLAQREAAPAEDAVRGRLHEELLGVLVKLFTRYIVRNESLD